ncbi:unnamed protein product [Effrenium voratum]|nr:unnamed protein product [Effrenium voratum]
MWCEKGCAIESTPRLELLLSLPRFHFDLAAMCSPCYMSVRPRRQRHEAQMGRSLEAAAAAAAILASPLCDIVEDEQCGCSCSSSTEEEVLGWEVVRVTRRRRSRIPCRIFESR